MIKGQCYRDNDIRVMILGTDELEYIHYISIQKDFVEASVQIYFAPIHEDSLNAFIERAEVQGIGRPDNIQVQIDRWLQQHNGGKTFFTVPVKKIVDYMLETLRHNKIDMEDFNKGKDSYDRDKYYLPAIFPTSEEMMNED